MGRGRGRRDGNIFRHTSEVSRVSSTMGRIYAAGEDVGREAVRADPTCVSPGRRIECSVARQGRQIRAVTKIRDPATRRSWWRGLRFIAAEMPQHGGFGAAVRVDHQFQGPCAGAFHRRHGERPARPSRSKRQISHTPCAIGVVTGAHPQGLESMPDVSLTPKNEAAGRRRGGDRADPDQPSYEQGDERPCRVAVGEADPDVGRAPIATLSGDCLAEFLLQFRRVGAVDGHRPELSIGHPSRRRAALTLSQRALLGSVRMSRACNRAASFNDESRCTRAARATSTESLEPRTGENATMKSALAPTTTR